MSKMMLLFLADDLAAVQLSNHNEWDTHYVFGETDTATASCIYTLTAAGLARIDMTQEADVEYPPEWLLGGSADSFECRFTKISGTPNVGTFNTWLSLGTDRSAGVQATITGPGLDLWACDFKVEIRRVSTLEIVASAIIKVRADAWNMFVSGA